MKDLVAGLVALGVLVMPAVAQADNPLDPAMRSMAARERDRQIIRQLNLEEAARVRERDAGYAQGWRAWRERDEGASANYGRQMQDHRREVDAYQRRRADYERDMAAWRRATAACNAGDFDACER